MKKYLIKFKISDNKMELGLIVRGEDKVDARAALHKAIGNICIRILSVTEQVDRRVGRRGENDGRA